MKTISYIILLFSLGALLQAQEVAISYEITHKTDQQATMQVYLQSLTDQDKAIKALNFSLALPEGCIKVTGQQSILSDAWTDYLQELQMTDQLDLNYNNWNYTHRWQYGSADPGMPTTAPILAPAQGSDPLMIMQISLEGSCADKIYLEQQAENPVNQMGDENVLPVEWTVIHPNTELELEKGLKLDMYPNPVEDFFTLYFDGVRENAYQFDLYSIEGRLLQSKTLDANGANMMRLNMENLPAAVYTLQIIELGTTREPMTVKVMKAR